MAIAELNGFKFIDGLKNKYESIVIESGKVDEYVKYIIDNEIKSVYLCSLYYSEDNMDFLKKCDFIEHLNITSLTINDYSVIECLHNLKSLILQDPDKKVNLRSNTKLEILCADWKNIEFSGIEQLKELKTLHIWHFNPKSRDLSSLCSLQPLEELELVQSTIDTLVGSEKLLHLKKLELHYLYKLKSINSLVNNKNTLEYLSINHCKKIEDYDSLARLDRLEKLWYCECGKIETISFINEMPRLKWFVFMGTEALDGDISPCERLEYTAFKNKKHYSHKIKFEKDKPVYRLERI